MYTINTKPEGQPVPAIAQQFYSELLGKYDDAVYTGHTRDREYPRDQWVGYQFFVPVAEGWERRTFRPVVNPEVPPEGYKFQHLWSQHIDFDND